MSLIFQWLQQLPSIYHDVSKITRPTIGVDAEGNCYIAHVTVTRRQTTVESVDICVVKFDTIGHVVWYRQQPSFDTNEDDVDPDISVDPAGNVYVVYSTGGESSGKDNTGLSDIVVFKLNADGDTQWVRQSPEFNIECADYSPSIATDSLGNVYVAYYTSNFVDPTCAEIIIVFKLDTSGNFIWSHKSGASNIPGGNYNPSIDVDGSGNCYIAYFCDSELTSDPRDYGSSYDIVVFKVDTDGNVVWIRQNPSFNTSSTDLTPSIAVTDNGTCCVAYYTINDTASSQTNVGNAGIIIFKLDTDGNTIWTGQRSGFNTSSIDVYVSIAVGESGYIYVTYSAASGQERTGKPDIVLFRLDNNGKTTDIFQQSLFNTDFENIYPAITIDTQGNCLVVYYSVSLKTSENSPQNLVVFKMRSLTCVTGDTKILMNDGSTKLIKEIRRGDLVAHNHQVACLCRERIDSVSHIDLMVFEKNCLGNCPNEQLVITPNHPIFYKNARRPAKCFKNCPGVTMIKNKPVNQMQHLLDASKDIYLYDLQFDHDGSYFANGVEIQSRSPYSRYGPLPQELYFDQSLYSNNQVWDSLDHILPLDDKCLNFNVIMLKNKRHNSVTMGSHSDCSIVKYT